MSRLIRRLAKHLLHKRTPRSASAHTQLPFRAWANHYLPHYFTLPPSTFHLWLSDLLDGLHRTRGQHWNILGPRGSAKSTWSTQAYPLYAALNGLEPFIILGSDSGGQAGSYLAAVRAELDGNARIAADYAAVLNGMRANSTGITLGNGMRIEPVSTGGKIRGRKHGSNRPTCIIVDDPQNIDHVTSPIMRQRSLDWLLKDVISAGTPQTNILVLGTALHRECIVCDLQRRPGWKSQVFRSIIQYPARMDLWAEWEMLLFNYDDDKREATARAFYEAHPEMND